MHDRISLSCLNFPTFTLPETLNALAELGVKRTTVPGTLLANHGWVRALQLIDDSDISAAALIAPFPKSLGDRGTWTDMRQEFCTTIDAAAELKATAVYSVTGPLIEQRDTSVAAFVDFIEPIVDYAQHKGIHMSLEPTLPSFAWVSFATSIAEAQDLMNATNLRMCLDLFHAWQDPRLDSFLSEDNDRISLVQVGDGIFRDGSQVKANLGDGIIPLTSLISKVENAGYKGVYDIEVTPSKDYYPEGLIPAARRAVERLDRLLSSLPT